MNDDNDSTDSIDMILADDITDRQHYDPPSRAILSLKRKQCYDEITLSEQIKRFKITTTPGELRLQKDLKEVQRSGLIGISIQYPDEFGGVTIEFVDVIPFAPSRFRVSVPRYYPHNHPIVFSLNEGYSCPFILSSGEIIHSSLREEWSAIGTLMTVIDVLQSIRLMFHNNNNYQTDPIHTVNHSIHPHSYTHSNSVLNSNSILHSHSSSHTHSQDNNEMKDNHGINILDIVTSNQLP